MLVMCGGGTIVVGVQIGSEASNSAQKKYRVEVDVLQSLWMRRDTVDEALEIGALDVYLATRSIE